MAGDRVILHCDCNSFFASVESVLNPAYRNVPMAVCGSEADRHGIVLAKNELAKKYGIQTAETVYSARKKCPRLVIAPPHHDAYVDFSNRVLEIYKDYTDLIEPFGIDESWLDVTASRRIFGTGLEIAEKIRQRVKEEIGITVSIGVSFNKVFAKLGSDYKKPDAITVISRENYKDIVYPLSAGALLYVGKKTEETLTRLGIRTIGELASVPRELLIKRFGKYGDTLYMYSNGLDDSPVGEGLNDDVKSVGNGHTFRHDLTSFEECRVGINYLCDEVARRLRHKDMRCTTVSLSIKDSALRTIQRQRPINPPTDISQTLSEAAYDILLDEWQEGRPVRSMTVTASNLVHKDFAVEQIDMFGHVEENNREKNRKREETVDIIKQKYGTSSIVRGAVMATDIGIEKNKS